MTGRYCVLKIHITMSEESTVVSTALKNNRKTSKLIRQHPRAYCSPRPYVSLPTTIAPLKMALKIGEFLPTPLSEP
jgi:hypothetical protein